MLVKVGRQIDRRRERIALPVRSRMHGNTVAHWGLAVLHVELELEMIFTSVKIDGVVQGANL